MEIWPLVFPAVMTSCCNSLTFLKSTHNLLFGGSPGADFFWNYDNWACPFRHTFGYNTSPFKRFYLPLYPFIMLQRKCVWSRSYRGAIPCIYVHFDKFCSADVLVVLGEGFSILITEFLEFLPNVCSNIFMLQFTLRGPGTSSGEQRKAVSCGISGKVSCFCGTQFQGLARCFSILSSLASSMLYVSRTGCSAKAITVSLPMYR